MLAKSELSGLIRRQRDKIMRQKSYLRKELHTIHLYDDFVLVISGIRRCGKSTLLSQLIAREMGNNRKDKGSADFLFLNFDTPQLFDFELSDFQLLDEIIEEQQTETLFFDEIQVVEGWEIYVRSKLDEGFRVVVTGSNASLLSKELGTKLTGRHISKELYPFSFVEYREYLGKENNAAAVKEYLLQGGFPQYLQLGEKEILEMLLNDIVYRDIVVRYGIRDASSLKRLVLFLAGNVGNLISANKLRANLAIKSTATVQDYLSFLENGYLIALLPKFAYSHKVRLVNPRKVYCINNGLQEVISPSFTKDVGRKLENAVYWELRRQYREIYYYNENNRECDFVIFEKGVPVKAVQVCLQLTTENRKREQQGVLDAMERLNLAKGDIITLEQEDKIVAGEKSIFVVPFYRYFL